MFKEIKNPIQGRVENFRNSVQKFQIVEAFLKEYITRLFPRISSNIVYSIEVKNKDIVVKFKNKIIAQELLFRREEIQSGLLQKGVTNKIVLI